MTMKWLNISVTVLQYSYANSLQNIEEHQNEREPHHTAAETETEILPPNYSTINININNPKSYTFVSG